MSSSEESKPVSMGSAWSLVLGLIGPPLVWFGNQQINYMLVEPTCNQDSFRWPLCIYLVALLGCVISGLASRRHYVSSPPANANGDSGNQLFRFLAFMGIFSAAVFGAVICVQATAHLVFDPCVRGG